MRLRRKDGKTIQAWAAEGDVDESQIKSNTFEMEWPLKSGMKQKFPEIDKALWFDINSASLKLQPAQVEFLKRLAEQLSIDFTPKISEQGTLF